MRIGHVTTGASFGATATSVSTPVPKSHIIDLVDFEQNLDWTSGYLTTIVIGPEHVCRNDWLDELSPLALSDNEQIGRLILRSAAVELHDKMVADLKRKPARYQLPFPEGDDRTASASRWARGFYDGVKARSSAWLPLLDLAEGRAMLGPIMGLLTNKNGVYLIEEEEEETTFDVFCLPRGKTPRQLVDLLSSAVIETYLFWRKNGSRRQRVSTSDFLTGKIGRNDPCPCGSGDKYKKCCLN